MGDMTMDEMLRKVSFLQQLANDIVERYDGIGGASDASATSRTGAIWFSAKNEDISWEDLREAMDEATRRLDDIGLEWSLDDTVQQREWKTHHITGTSGPYSGEINIQDIGEEAISKYEKSYVDGEIPDEPKDAYIYREAYEEEQEEA